MQQRPRGPFVWWGLCLTILLVFTVPVGVSADTATPATVNTSVTFSGGGFAPNESLSIYETGPDGTSLPVSLPGAQTDGSGGFTVSVMFPSVGTWTVTAHSIATGKDVVGTYMVSTAPSTTTTSSPVTQPTNGPPATGTPVGVGVSITFTGAGFNPNENISVWETPPDGSIPTALPGIQADSSGTFTDSVSFPSDGQWQVTAQGRASGHQVIARFAVGTIGPVTAPTGGAGFNGTPASIGTPVTFSGSGFNGNELISLWTTAPDSTTAPLIGIQADGTGGFTDEVTFPSAGNWQVTAEGHTSKHQVIGRYSVTDPSSSTTTAAAPSSTFIAPSTSVPVQVTAGANVTFTAIGFNAGENVAVWTTAPDTTVATLASVQATSLGRATITTSFASAGLWQITLRGHDSTHEVIGQFQVTSPA
ncbi:MAG: hypothetical protein ACYDAR_03550 [Thermomicrobiales bacterium]